MVFLIAYALVVVLLLAVTNAFVFFGPKNRLLKCRNMHTEIEAEDSPSLQEIGSRLGESVKFAAGNQQRLRYATAQTARFGYFLGQGLGLSLLGQANTPGQDTGPKGGGGSVN